MKTRRAAATIKFIDLDIPTGKVELMVGFRTVVIPGDAYMMLLAFEKDSYLTGFERKSRCFQPSVFKFMAKNCMRSEGYAAGELICEMLGIEGQLV